MARHSLHIDFDPAENYALPMIFYQEGKDNYFCRLLSLWQSWMKPGFSAIIGPYPAQSPWLRKIPAR